MKKKVNKSLLVDFLMDGSDVTKKHTQTETQSWWKKKQLQ